MGGRSGGQPPMDRKAEKAIRGRIGLLIRHNGGTPARLAHHIGVPASTVRGWLKDKTPSVTHILAISARLNVSPAWLLVGDEPQLRPTTQGESAAADAFWQIMRQHCRTVLVADGIPDDLAEAIVGQFFEDQQGFSFSTAQRLFEWELERWMEARKAGPKVESHGERMAAIRRAIGAPEPKRSPLLPWPPPATATSPDVEAYTAGIASTLKAKSRP